MIDLAIEKAQRLTGTHKLVAKILSSNEDDVVVDLGCGDGWILSLIEAKEKIGVDLSRKRLKRAKERGASPVLADVACLPFRDNMFTKAIASEVLEHLPRPDSFMIEIIRCCKRNANAVFVVPEDLTFSLYQLLSLQWKALLDAKKRHLSRWNLNRLVRYINKFHMVAEKLDYYKVLGIPFHYIARIRVIK